jgi:hypothetical protein
MLARPADRVLVGHVLLRALGQQDAFDDERASRDAAGPFDTAENVVDRFFCRQFGLLEDREPARSVRYAELHGQFRLVPVEFRGLHQRVQSRCGIPAGIRHMAFEFEDELFQSAHASIFHRAHGCFRRRWPVVYGNPAVAR